MAKQPSGPVTQCLVQLENGDRAAAERLMPLIYEDLRALAAGVFRRKDGHTLQPTALVHEAYLRLVGSGQDWSSRRHFFGVAAIAMRQLLADHARRRSAQKRGGDRERVVLEEAAIDTDPGSKGIDLVDLHDALGELEKLEARQARIVELRFLSGLTIDETAEVLGIAPRTVRLDWQMARNWLDRRLSAQPGE